MGFLVSLVREFKSRLKWKPRDNFIRKKNLYSMTTARRRKTEKKKAEPFELSHRECQLHHGRQGRGLQRKSEEPSILELCVKVSVGAEAEREPRPHGAAYS